MLGWIKENVGEVSEEAHDRLRKEASNVFDAIYCLSSMLECRVFNEEVKNKAEREGGER